MKVNDLVRVQRIVDGHGEMGDSQLSGSLKAYESANEKDHEGNKKKVKARRPSRTPEGPQVGAGRHRIQE